MPHLEKQIRNPLKSQLGQRAGISQPGQDQLLGDIKVGEETFTEQQPSPLLGGALAGVAGATIPPTPQTEQPQALQEEIPQEQEPIEETPTDLLAQGAKVGAEAVQQEVQPQEPQPTEGEFSEKEEAIIKDIGAQVGDEEGIREQMREIKVLLAQPDDEFPDLTRRATMLLRKNKPEILEDLRVALGEEAVQEEAQAEPGFLGRIGKGITERAEAIQNIPTDDQTSFESFIQETGLSFAALGDVVGEVVTTGIKAIPFAEEVGTKLLESTAGQKGLKAIQAGQEKFEEFAEENPRLAKNIVGALQIGFGAAELTGTAALRKPLTKAVKKIGEVGAKVIKPFVGASESLVSKISGLSPNTVNTIVNDFKTFEKAQSGIINREKLAETLKSGIDEQIKNVSSTGKGFDEIRKLDIEISNPIDEINSVLENRGIQIGKGGKLDFSDSAILDGGTDANAIQKAYNISIRKKNLTTNDILNNRSKTDELINFQSQTTSKGQGIVKEMRRKIDDKAKNEIPGLRELDSKFSTEKQLLQSIKKDFVDSKTGELKDGAMSKIANLTNKGNEQKLERIKKLIPGIENDINAIKALDDVALASGQKVGTYFQTGATVAGGFAGGPAGAIATAVLTSPSIVVPALKLYGKTANIAGNIIDGIVSKIKLGQKLTSSESKIIQGMFLSEVVNEALKKGG